jgi:hypothetical protein
MPHHSSRKRPSRTRIKTARKEPASRTSERDRSRAAAWVAALARVKRHVQHEGRHRSHAG